MQDEAENRLRVLEERVAHQEAAIEDLNAIVTAQWSKVDALARQFARLDERLGEAEARVGAVTPQQPPPHY